MQRRGDSQSGRYVWSSWTFALLFLLLIAFSQQSPAQAIWAEGGTSTMIRASGFELNYDWKPMQGWFGAGWQQGFTFGGFMQTQLHGYDVGIGDRYQPMVLDTDVFDQSRYFAERGVFLLKRDESRTVSAFAGSTANEQATTFYRAFTANQPTGGLFVEQKIGDRASFHSVDLVQDRMTSIQSFRYKVSDDVSVSAAGGVGHGSGFLSFATEMKRRLWRLTASYTEAGNDFERVGGVLTNAAERVGLNARFQYQPKRNVFFTLDHENLLSPTIVENQLPQRVSLDSVDVGTSLKNFRLSAGATTSTSGNLHTNTENASVSRNLFSGISASGGVMRIVSNYENTTIVIGNVREKVSPRLSLNQGISAQSNSKNFTWGVNWLSNRFTIGVQQDMLYTPLAGGFNGKLTESMWAVNLVAPLWRSTKLHVDSFVDPAGKVRYTAWLDGIGWSRHGVQIASHPELTRSSFGKFVVAGMVVDTAGNPVFGIAVQVDGQTAFSDNTGHFFLRFDKGLTYPLAVLPDRSLSSQYYQVVQAPVSATAETDDIAHQIVIVLKRADPPKKRRAEGDTQGPTTTAAALTPAK